MERGSGQIYNSVQRETMDEERPKEENLKDAIKNICSNLKNMGLLKSK